MFVKKLQFVKLKQTKWKKGVFWRAKGEEEEYLY